MSSTGYRLLPEIEHARLFPNVIGFSCGAGNLEGTGPEGQYKKVSTIQRVGVTGGGLSATDIIV